MRIACFYFSTPLEVERVAEVLLRFSPQIALREPDAVFVEIGKCYRLYTEEEFLRKSALVFRRLGLPAQIGLGASIEEALLAAKYGISDPTLLPLRALFDLADPLSRDPKSRHFVEKLVASLGQLGIKCLAQFRAVPRSELSSRFGPVGLLCRQKVDGELLVPWKPWLPPEVIRESMEYPYSDFHATMEPLLFDAKKLLDRIFARLRLRGLHASALQIEILCERSSANPQRERKMTIEFLLPQSETKGTLVILRDFFAKEFAQRPILSPPEKFTLTVAQTTPGSFGQKNLYHAREERQEAYAAFVSQFSQAHGKGSTFQAQTVEERLPEYSWEKVAKAKKQTELQGRVPLRPTNLTKPQRIAVSRDTIRTKKKAFRILRWAESIERISCRWLEAPVERTYFQVEVEGDLLLWIYRDQEKNYYLHGYYG